MPFSKSLFLQTFAHTCFIVFAGQATDEIERVCSGQLRNLCVHIHSLQLQNQMLMRRSNFIDLLKINDFAAHYVRQLLAENSHC